MHVCINTYICTRKPCLEIVFFVLTAAMGLAMEGDQERMEKRYLELLWVGFLSGRVAEKGQQAGWTVLN